MSIRPRHHVRLGGVFVELFKDVVFRLIPLMKIRSEKWFLVSKAADLNWIQG